MIKKKEQKLIRYLKDVGRIAVAFSGGMDSAYLVYAAKEALGAEGVLVLTARTELGATDELARAERMAHGFGVRHKFVTFSALAPYEVRRNDIMRCYYCKRGIFAMLIQVAQMEGFPLLADGTNCDDDSDFRPGIRAAQEMGVVSPLKLAGMDKKDVNALSKEAGLETAGLPSNSCLATRIEQGTELRVSVLRMIDAAECELHSAGFDSVRIRVHGNCARLEVPSTDMYRAFAQRDVISSIIRSAGFGYASLDMQGYRPSGGAAQ